MNKKVNKDIITNYKDCKYYKKGKEKTALCITASGWFCVYKILPSDKVLSYITG